MKINTVKLSNYRGFKDIALTFSNTINVFVGINGSGKSSVLDSLAISLSWLINRIQRDRAHGLHIPELDIHNDQKYASITIQLEHNKAHYEWHITKSAKGADSKAPSYEGVSNLATIAREEYNDRSGLPVIAYYDIKRTVDRFPANRIDSDPAANFDVYKDALRGRSDYLLFFKWFREQDDILNELSHSRSHWLRQHRTWVDARIKAILNAFEKLPIADGSTLSGTLDLLKNMFDKEFLTTDQNMLLMGLSQLIQGIKHDSSGYSDLVNPIIFDFEYILLKLASLSQESQDNLIDNAEGFFQSIEKLYTAMQKLAQSKKGNAIKPVFTCMWEIFSMIILISLWWLNNNNQKKVERILDSEHTKILEGKPREHDLIGTLREITNEDIASQNTAQRNEGKALPVVKRAIEAFLSGYTNLGLRRLPRPHLELSKNGEVFNVDQLSDGEKNFIALIGDIARRLTMANPNKENPLEGEGIILIDEIDLHLHPEWQRTIVPRLEKTFPHCQFFISTHSPQVISHVNADNIFLLKNNKKYGITCQKATESYGKNSDRILEDIMGVPARPKHVHTAIREIFELIQKGEIEKAHEEIVSLRKEIGDDNELVKAEVLIKRRELIGK